MEEQDLLRILSRNWGECRQIGREAGGYRNTVLVVEREGERLVAKSSRRSTEQINWLVDVQESAREVGFVVPHLIRSQSGELLVEGVMVESWIEGSAPRSSDLLQLPPLIREFHRRTRSFPQRPGFASSLELVTTLRGGDVDISAMPVDLIQACRKTWRELAGEATSVVHGDLNRSNLLVTADGLLALVDWDEARVDVSVLDEAALRAMLGQKDGCLPDTVWRALLAWEVAVSWKIEPEHAKRLAAELLS
jgi:Ser/Thr protein kinase RdoA (MazF antagonist)